MKTEHLLIITLVVLLVAILLVGFLVVHELKDDSGNEVSDAAGSKSSAKVSIDIAPPVDVAASGDDEGGGVP